MLYFSLTDLVCSLLLGDKGLFRHGMTVQDLLSFESSFLQLLNIQDAHHAFQPE